MWTFVNDDQQTHGKAMMAKRATEWVWQLERGWGLNNVSHAAPAFFLILPRHIPGASH